MNAGAARHRYSGQHRCNYRDVTVERMGGGAYRVDGCAGEQVYTCVKRICVPDHGPVAASARHGNAGKGRPDRTPRPRRALQAEEDVVAAQGEEGGRQLVVTRRGDDRRLHFRQLSKGERQLRGCRDLSIQVGGAGGDTIELSARYRSRPNRRGDYHEDVSTRLTPAALEALAGAGAPTVRACRQETPVDEAFSAALADSLKRTISTRVPFHGIEMLLQARPADPGDEVWLGFSIRSPSHGYSRCQIDLLANGEPVALPAFSYVEGAHHDRYQVKVPIERIAEMVEHERTVGRVCDLRFELDQHDRGLLAEFLMRFKEERAFAGTPETPVDEPTAAPAGSTAL